MTFIFCCFILFSAVESAAFIRAAYKQLKVSSK